MKIVNRKDFLNLPSGTLWSYYEPCVFRDLSVKTSDNNDYKNDFVYFGLIGEFDCSNGFSETCQRMELGESIPASFEETQREGLFDEEQLFLVYEQDDIKRMVEVLNNLLKSNPQ